MGRKIHKFISVPACTVHTLLTTPYDYYNTDFSWNKTSIRISLSANEVLILIFLTHEVLILICGRCLLPGPDFRTDVDFSENLFVERQPEMHECEVRHL